MNDTTQTAKTEPERPFSMLTTVYFANPAARQFFKQNSPTGGTYLECWVKGREFCHILSTVELGKPEKLKAWMEEKRLQPATIDDYDSYFFQLCREIDAKRELKNQERQMRFEAMNQKPAA